MFTRSRQPPHVMGTRMSVVPAWMGHQVAASLSSEERRSSCLPHTPPTGPALRGALPRSADPSSYWNRLQRCPVLGEPGPPSGPRGTNAAAQTCSHSCSPPPPHCPELGLASSPLPPHPQDPICPGILQSWCELGRSSGTGVSWLLLTSVKISARAWMVNLKELVKGFTL